MIKIYLKGRNNISQTADKLDFIEPSKFEELSNLIISFKYGINIISTGLNQEGKPIKCPIDAIGIKKDNGKTEYVFIEATTTQLEGLEYKWLNKSDEKLGDVIKTYNEAKEFYKQNKNSSFKLFLMTNRRLSGNKGLNLIKAVYKEEFEIPLEIEIMEQKTITQFLDYNCDGQYLRNQFLQISAERLSKPLLHEICQKNLENYKNFINTTGFNYLIEREELPSIEKQVNSNELSFLIGESGYGKSIISFQILQRHIENGGYGFWISEEFLKDSTNLSFVLDELLRQYYPKLGKNSGEDALNLNSNENFLIIFDDLNRSQNPKKLVKKIISWSENIRSDIKSDNYGNHYKIRIVCPIWNKYAKIFYETNSNHFSTINIEKLKNNDGIKLIKKVANEKNIILSDLEIKNYLKKLDFDPFYTGIFLSQLDKNKNLDNLINNTFKNFLNRKFEELDEEEFLPQDYERVLLNLSKKMLENHKLIPNLTEMDIWLDNEIDKKILRILIKDGKICNLNNDANLYFIHDRIKFYYLIMACTTIIKNYPESEIFDEPYYAEIIGASLNNIGKNKNFIDTLKEKNLLALFESIKYVDETNENYNQILRILINWSKEKHVSNSFQEEVVRTLFTYDSQLVVKLLCNINSHCINIPCFRNGSTVHGIREAGIIFGANDLLFKQTIEHVKIYHKDKIIKDIIKILSSKNLENRILKETFLLAGYLGFEELETIIIDSIKLFKNFEDNLDAIIFATFRCVNNDINFVENLLEQWNNIGVKYNDENRWPFLDELRFSFRNYHITNKVLNYLCFNYHKFTNITHLIWIICSEINNPLSLKMTIDHLSNNENLFYIYLSLFRRIQLSSESRKFLENYYQKEEVDSNSKKFAFRLWALNCNQKDLSKLQKFDKDNILYSDSIIARIKLGDFTALTPLIENFNKETILNEIHNVWNENAKLFIEKYFIDMEPIESKEIEEGYEYYSLTRCLAKIPLKDSEYYIKTYWEKIKYYRIFIQLNFYLCTDLTIGLNNDIFNEIQPNNELFKYFAINFLDMDDFDKFSTEHHFNEIMDYLIYFDDVSVYSIFQKAEKFGYCRWIKKACCTLNKNISFIIQCQTDNDIVNEMKLNDKYYYWSSKFENKCFNKNRINRVLKLYLKNNPNLESFINVAMYLKENGNRDDLKILYDSNIKDKEQIIHDVEFNVKCRTLV